MSSRQQWRDRFFLVGSCLLLGLATWFRFSDRGAVSPTAFWFDVPVPDVVPPSAAAAANSPRPVFVFTDLRCRSCARWHAALDTSELVRRGVVKVHVLVLPRGWDTTSVAVNRAALCAIFTGRIGWADAYAKAQAIGPPTAEACPHETQVDSALQVAGAFASQLGVPAAPALVVGTVGHYGSIHPDTLRVALERTP